MSDVEMTLEEAAEIILAGGAHIVCPHCQGLGMMRPLQGEGGKSGDIPQHSQTSVVFYGGAGGVAYGGAGGSGRSSSTFGSCSECEGTGALLLPEYAEACRVLDKPLPVLPKKGFTFTLGGGGGGGSSHASTVKVMGGAGGGGGMIVEGWGGSSATPNVPPKRA